MENGDRQLKSLILDTDTERSEKLIKIEGESLAIYRIDTPVTIKLDGGAALELEKPKTLNTKFKWIYLSHSALPGGKICIAWASYKNCLSGCGS